MRHTRTDHRLQRRNVLREVSDGVRSPDDVRDAHPDLVRAGHHIGETADGRCPLCTGAHLREVHYVFELRGSRRSPSGRALPREALARHAARHGDLAVYLVEVCTACHWHHLLESFHLEAQDTAVG